jgi:mono/diheme cytochrome c family protein
MDEDLRARGLTRPTFQEGEIVDLSSYIRAATRGSELRLAYMSPGNPQRGSRLLQEKGCLNCHSLRGEGGDFAGDFADQEWNYSVTEIAGLMWNHGSTMSSLMEEMRIEWPSFEGGEMADLISYLYFLGFEGTPGDPKSGTTLFLVKGCANCHGAGGRGGDLGPDLTSARGLSSTTDMAWIMWNHAPVMEEQITERAIKWPRLEGKEMADLYAHLHELSKKRDANQPPSP